MELQAADGPITVLDDQITLPLAGLEVQDGVLMIQVVERLLKSGSVAGSELYPLGIFRERVVQSISSATSADNANKEMGIT